MWFNSVLLFGCTSGKPFDLKKKVAGTQATASRLALGATLERAPVKHVNPATERADRN
jgi:hypothetical protein